MTFVRAVAAQPVLVTPVVDAPPVAPRVAESREQSEPRRLPPADNVVGATPSLPLSRTTPVIADDDPRIAARAHDAAVALIARHRSPWQGLAGEVQREWDKRPEHPASMQRMVRAVFAPSGDQVIGDPVERARAAVAVIGRLTDRQLRALDADTEAALVAGLRGDGTARPNVTQTRRLNEAIASRFKRAD